MSMRTFYGISFLFILCGAPLLSNPLPLPQAFISELLFDGTGGWKLEISFQFSSPYHATSFDSMYLGNETGMSRIRLDHIQEGTELFVISIDSLVTPLSFQSEGDVVALYSYVMQHSYAYGDSLAIGSHPGSPFPFLSAGYSICRFDYHTFYKDKSPTIGAPNDTAGSCGTLRGKIYDKTGAFVNTGTFFLDNHIILTGNGNYSTAVFSRTFLCTSVTTRQYLPNYTMHHSIDSISITMEIDSVIERDIHFKDYIVGVKGEIIDQGFEASVMNYPNPFNAGTNFAIKIPHDIIYNKASIEIFSIIGERVCTIPIENGSTIRWEGKNNSGITVSTGTYFYQLLLDNVPYTKGSMVFLK